MRQRCGRGNDADDCEEASDVEAKLLTNEEDPNVVVRRILGDLPKMLCEDPRGNIECFGVPLED